MVTRFGFFLFFTSIVCSVCLGFYPVDNYLIDCGSLGNTSIGDRIFVSDRSAAGLLSTKQDVFANSTSNPSTNSPESPLYRTARIFTDTVTYKFSIKKKGRHFIRIYLNPFVFERFNMSKANFSVSANGIGLIGYATAKNSTVTKEYSMNLTTDTLIVILIPAENSFSYLNALEVVSLPDELITDDARTVSPLGDFHGLLDEAMETVVRVNMGGSFVSSENDTLWRTWAPDSRFLKTPNLASVSNTRAVNYGRDTPSRLIAPASVYGTAIEMNSGSGPRSKLNVTWEFDIDPGFQYFVRYHFCDIVSEGLNILYFNVYLDNWTAYSNLDLSILTQNMLSAPYYIDVVTPLLVDHKMSVKVGPSDIAPSPNAILNGLEVMKMSSSLGSLSGIFFLNPSSSRKNVGLIVGLTMGGFILVIVVVLGFLWCRRTHALGSEPRTKIWIPLSTIEDLHTVGSKFSNGTTASNAGSNYGYRFPFSAVLEATNGFDENWVIGIGGFGKVHKGALSDGTKVAVKRCNPSSQQGLAEFRTEIEMLSRFRHRHLVSLIGYCDEKNEMILIYDYMENGTLKSHLYGSDLPSLTWKQRLEICIGAARGLHYLHTACAKAVIHRDVKSANILLDENLTAKVADFGLSKMGPDFDQSHVSTAVKGSFGYLDPEYFRLQQLTEKSDVYSFGVVLFEVICARSVIDPSRPREMVNLAEWAMKWQKKRQLGEIIDRNLVGPVQPDSLKKFGETAEKCLAEFGFDRPSMGDVLWNLEYALELQEGVVRSDSEEEENSTNMIGDLPPQVNTIGYGDSDSGASTAVFEDTAMSYRSGVSMSLVFSQLVKSEGHDAGLF